MRTPWLIAAVVCTLLATSCGNHRKSADWRTSDEVHIAVDQTFQDIMEDELQTFARFHVEAEPRPVYVSEDSALWLLLNDSVRSALVTRALTDQERLIVESHRLSVKQALVAYDAFALIVNKANSDTVISVDELRDIVSGRITRWEQLKCGTRHGELKLVFDQSGSSTVRYMRDSLLLGGELKGNIYAQGGNRDVIETVKQDPEVIGVVGTNWLKARGDSALTSFDNLDVKVLKVTRKYDEDPIGWRPYQYRIMTGDYPLVRSVYLICTDPFRKSKTTTFFYFLKGDAGQRIICNDSQLLPRMQVQFRSVTVQ